MADSIRNPAIDTRMFKDPLITLLQKVSANPMITHAKDATHAVPKEGLNPAIMRVEIRIKTGT